MGTTPPPVPRRQISGLLDIIGSFTDTAFNNVLVVQNAGIKAVPVQVRQPGIVTACQDIDRRVLAGQQIQVARSVGQPFRGFPGPRQD